MQNCLPVQSTCVVFCGYVSYFALHRFELQQCILYRTGYKPSTTTFSVLLLGYIQWRCQGCICITLALDTKRCSPTILVPCSTSFSATDGAEKSACHTLPAFPGVRSTRLVKHHQRKVHTLYCHIISTTLDKGGIGNKCFISYWHCEEQRGQCTNLTTSESTELSVLSANVFSPSVLPQSSAKWTETSRFLHSNDVHTHIGSVCSHKCGECSHQSCTPSHPPPAAILRWKFRLAETPTSWVEKHGFSASSFHQQFHWHFCSQVHNVHMGVPHIKFHTLRCEAHSALAHHRGHTWGPQLTRNVQTLLETSGKRRHRDKWPHYKRALAPILITFKRHKATKGHKHKFTQTERRG